MRRLTHLCQAGQDLSDQRIACAIKLEDYLANTPKHELEVTLIYKLKVYCVITSIFTPLDKLNQA
jgi:hypothetical protein